MISYRRSDSAGITGRIYDRLVSRYGKSSVFIDIDVIPLGVDFHKRIEQALDETDVFLAVIGPRWLGVREDGRARIDDDDDAVRVEVQMALRSGLVVIPVLVDGATMPAASVLPADLQALPSLNAAEISAGKDFEHHVNRLLRFLDTETAARDGALPAQGTSFIGRERELHDLKRLVSEQRIVTLSGPGGIGKTRLSLQLATEVSADFGERCWFASLVGIENEDLVAHAVADALGVVELPMQPLAETLAHHVGQRRALLVIDNAEHVLTGVAALVRTLVAACKQIVIVIASREPVHVAGEHVVRVMPLPDSDGERLFVERGRAVRSEFAVREAERPLLHALLQQLEGIPLAIELAAARLSTFTIKQLAERISSRLALASRDTTADSRQRTLRNTIDWSYQLLDDEQKNAFARLSIFEGRFTLEAYEAIVRVASSRPADEFLESLVEKSLVNAELAAEISSYTLLGLLREFGLERLKESGDIDSIADLHFSYYLRIASAGEKLEGKLRTQWLDAVDLEIADHRAALTWALERDPARAATLAVSLSLYWQVRSHIAEARIWLRQVIEKGGNLPPAQLAALLDRASVFATMHDDYAEARLLCARARVLYQGLKDPIGLGKSVHALAVIEDRAGNVKAAREHYTRSIEVLRGAHAPRLLGTALANLAKVDSEAGDIARAQAGLAESLALAESVGDPNLTSSILLKLANVEMQQNALGRAEMLLLRALEVKRELRNTVDIADALTDLAKVVARQHRPEHARAYAKDALRIALELQSKALTVKGLEAFAQVLLSESDYRGAARLLGLVEFLRSEGKIRGDQYLADAALLMREKLGDEEFRRLTTEGAGVFVPDEAMRLLA